MKVNTRFAYIQFGWKCIMNDDQLIQLTVMKNHKIKIKKSHHIRIPETVGFILHVNIKIIAIWDFMIVQIHFNVVIRNIFCRFYNIHSY